MRTFPKSRRVLAAALLALAAASAALAEDVEVRLVQRGAGDYEVQGLFFVEASSSAAWSVLTDYEAIPRFVSSMRASRVVGERPDGTLVVEQEAVGGVFLMTRKVRVLLEITREPERLSFVDLSLRDFSDYRGSWRTQDSTDGTLVIYHLRARPSFFAPGLLARGSMRRGARDLLTQVRAEILRRAWTRGSEKR